MKTNKYNVTSVETKIEYPIIKGSKGRMEKKEEKGDKGRKMGVKKQRFSFFFRYFYDVNIFILYYCHFHYLFLLVFI